MSNSAGWYYVLCAGLIIFSIGIIFIWIGLKKGWFKRMNKKYVTTEEMLRIIGAIFIMLIIWFVLFNGIQFRVEISDIRFKCPDGSLVKTISECD